MEQSRQSPKISQTEWHEIFLKKTLDELWSSSSVPNIDANLNEETLW
jgi:hypothetical protein